ncbi:MAG: bifunctional DNA primase/polymerase [Pseudomonadota bacterium]
MSNPAAVSHDGASNLNYFAVYAARCHANGYSVVSRHPQQRPPRAGLDWRNACWSRVSADWVQQHTKTDPQSGVSFACGRHTVAFDIDVDNEETVKVLSRLVEQVCGQTPLKRVGRPPRVALVYRAAEPIISIRLPRFDVLGLGTALAGYGIHTGTGKPYRWIGGTAPHLTLLEDLPSVTNGQCNEIVSDLMRRVVGDGFERFVFDADRDLLAACSTTRRTLTKYLLMSIRRGLKRTRQTFSASVEANEIPPGYFGFIMRPVVRGGFDYLDFMHKLDACEII